MRRWIRALIAASFAFGVVVQARRAPAEEARAEAASVETAPDASPSVATDAPASLEACPPGKVGLDEIGPWVERRHGAEAEAARWGELRRALEGEASAEATLTEDDLRPGLSAVTREPEAAGLTLEAIDCSEHPCIAAYRWDRPADGPGVDVPGLARALKARDDWEGLELGAMFTPIDDGGAVVLFSIFEEERGSGRFERVMARWQVLQDAIKAQEAP